MKASKKTVISSVLAFFALPFVFATSWSGSFDNVTKVSSSDFSDLGLYQSNGIYFSFDSNFSDSKIRFTSEVSYKYALTVPSFNENLSKNIFKNIIDVDLLKVSGKWALSRGALSLNAGRFVFSDLSGAVFSQNGDGIHISYDSMKIKSSFYAGYTGLLNSLNVSMADAAPSSNDFYNLALGYIPVAAEIAFPSVLNTNTIAFQLMCFFEPSKKYSSKYYGTVSLFGPVSDFGNYSFAAIFGSEDFNNLFAYSNLDFSFYSGNAGIISVGAEYASGNQFGLSPFKSITLKTAYNSTISVPVSAVVLPKVSASFIMKDAVLSLTEKLVMKAPEKIGVNGFETSANVVYNVLSDVQIRGSISSYFDFKDSNSNHSEITFNAMLAF